MSKICNICQQQFDWKKPYDGSKLNLDGSLHDCKGTQTKSSGGYSKMDLGQAPEVLNLALELGDTILKRIEGTVEPKEQIVMIESLFKTLSQSYKGE